MHEFVLYDERSGKISGYFRTTIPDLQPQPSLPGLSQVEVLDDEHRKLLSAVSREKRLTGTVRDGRIASLKLESIFKGKIVLTADAPDLDKDGRPELAADGESTTRISAEFVAADGTAVRNAPASVRFSVTRGTLSRRDAPTERGVAVVELRSSVETVQTEILATADGFERGSLTVEFIPPAEHRNLLKEGPAKAR